jgi:glyoxylase-like metal-dependent hydrolase (beta-lactamase superfamily II)
MAVVVQDEVLQIEGLVLGLYETNAYILVCQKTKDSVLIDAPAEATKIIEKLRGTNPKRVLLTHTHGDHIGALQEIRSRLQIPVSAHLADARSLSSPPEIPLGDGDVILLGNIRIEVIHTPGHTAGGLCFKTERYLLSGDTLFPGGPGQTKSPADLKQIISSITSRLLPLDDDTLIFPGHGNSTILKKEKDEFAIFSSRAHPPSLCGDVLWLLS